MIYNIILKSFVMSQVWFTTLPFKALSCLKYDLQHYPQKLCLVSSMIYNITLKSFILSQVWFTTLPSKALSCLKYDLNMDVFVYLNCVFFFVVSCALLDYKKNAEIHRNKHFESPNDESSTFLIILRFQGYRCE